MARKQRDQQADEMQGAEPYSSAPAFNQMDIVDTSATMVNPSPVRPSAVERDGRALAEIPPARAYRVLQTAHVMSRGGRTLLRAGKLVDELNYDIDSLCQQGVQLAEVPR